MKKVSLILNAVVMAIALFTSCGKPSEEVTIGNQVWMTKNLNVIKFRNGDPIPEVKTAEEWMKAHKEKQPAWCYYDNDPANGEKYGRLYNWYAVNDQRGLAPEGWSIPFDKDWRVLFTHLGGADSAGIKLKSKIGWMVQNGNVKKNNLSGFNAIPGGGVIDDGRSSEIGNSAFFWGILEEENPASSVSNVVVCSVSNLTDYAEVIWTTDYSGFSVRCLKK
jgi:uncharacterized protein (TIGR02145 family)